MSKIYRLTDEEISSFIKEVSKSSYGSLVSQGPQLVIEYLLKAIKIIKQQLEDLRPELVFLQAGKRYVVHELPDELNSEPAEYIRYTIHPQTEDTPSRRLTDEEIEALINRYEANVSSRSLPVRLDYRDTALAITAIKQLHADVQKLVPWSHK
jgi:hypothetical protein